ncbi:hypothetical protein I3842_01G214100 [Carya illinoinensis]|uniref:Uncharacterized protein n=1 Tax=Carya illinoinensis TaxID=32201 RepID=A0A922G336_CARIL|nr:hypothetical protein I3842_01G214100 [Carya illinoinensis]KAG6733187.1 hypothetical protein I3842_01G214100 [Carya illinoinensis]
MLTLTMHVVHDVPKHLHDIFLEYHDGHPSIFSKYDPNNNILIVTHYSIGNLASFVLMFEHGM